MGEAGIARPHGMPFALITSPPITTAETSPMTTYRRRALAGLSRTSLAARQWHAQTTLVNPGMEAGEVPTPDGATR